MINDHRLIHLRSLREYELKLVLNYLPPSSRILEIGAGAGWQAKQLAEQGHEVIALDINDSRLSNHRVYPIQDFDGLHIPFPDKSFDVVYSSNVLEHITDMGTLEKEISRVLTPEGVIIHILPTAAWRIWTSLTHPIYLVQLVYKHLQTTRDPAATQKLETISIPPVWRLGQYLLPHRHGVRGNIMSELIFFSKHRWTNHFNNMGFQVQLVKPSGILYSGNQIFHTKLDLLWRRRISQFLGSATYIWILQISKK